jgi:CelD/BcsL family acetyltransferase involved in cellulose biosynthesis
MIDPPDRYEIITDHNRFLSLKHHWDDLYERSAEHDLTHSFEWCRSSWEIIAKPRSRRLHCLIARRRDRPVLIWPFLTYRQGMRILARPLGPETSEYSGVLVEHGPESDQNVFLAWRLLRKSLRADKITLPFVKAGSSLHCAIKSNETAALSKEVWPTRCIRWDGHRDWESYYRSLKSDFRAELRRTSRRLSERGDLTIELVNDDTQIPRVLDWLFRYKLDWLFRYKSACLAKANQMSVWQEADVYKTFFVAVSQTKLGQQIRLFILKFDGQIIAGVLCRMSKSRLELVIATYDPAFRKYGPGHLLYEGVFKWAFERRLECDFRLGRQTYKELWANSTSETITYCFVNSLRGVAFISAKRLMAGASNILGRRVLREASDERGSRAGEAGPILSI